MRALHLTLLFTVVAAASSGCGLFSSHNPSRSSPAATGQVLVAVENHNWNDITIYLMAGGLPQRLGMVTALSRANFDFSSHQLNPSRGVRLRALPVAGHAFTSETILVMPGQVITWTLENDLAASSFSVY
jgi:hypothetical protein